MITKTVLWGLILVTAVAFSFVYVELQQYWLTAVVVGLGVIWLNSEVQAKNPSPTAFFLSFLVLAIVGSLRNAPILVILLGFSADLAAWDLSRFQARIAGKIERDTTKALEIRHLQKLTVTASAGYLIALPPVFIHFSIDFVIFGCVMVLAMIALRRSILYFRGDHEGRV